MKSHTIRLLAATFLCLCTTKGMVQEFPLSLYGARPVHGTVRDPQGRPLKDVEVRSSDLGPGGNAPPFHTLALTDQSGGFVTEGEDMLFLEKKGYTPAAMRLADKDEPLSVVLVPESKKKIPKCAGATDLPSIRVTPLRYSLPSGITWKEQKGDRPGFTICTICDQEWPLIYAADEREDSLKPDLPSGGYQPKYRVTQEFEYHPEIADFGDLKYSEIFASSSGWDWTNWSGTTVSKPWRWFKGPNQIAHYYDVSNKSAKVFDAIINSACREKDFSSPAKKAAK